MKGPGWCGAEAATSRIPPLRALPASQLLPSPARCRPVGLTGSRAGRNFSSLAAGGAGQGPALSRPVSHRPACTTCSILPRMSGKKNNKPTKKTNKALVLRSRQHCSAGTGAGMGVPNGEVTGGARDLWGKARCALWDKHPWGCTGGSHTQPQSSRGTARSRRAHRRASALEAPSGPELGQVAHIDPRRSPQPQPFSSLSLQEPLGSFPVTPAPGRGHHRGCGGFVRTWAWAALLGAGWWDTVGPQEEPPASTLLRAQPPEASVVFSSDPSPGKRSPQRSWRLRWDTGSGWPYSDHGWGDTGGPQEEPPAPTLVQVQPPAASSPNPSPSPASSSPRGLLAGLGLPKGGLPWSRDPVN